MTLWSATRVLLVKWYVTMPGLLLSLIAAAITFSLMPPVYTSSGAAILVQSKQPGSNLANPLLSFESSLSTTAAILIQGLNSPAVAPGILLSAGDSYTVKSTGDGVTTGDPSVQPFIYVKTQSRTADASVVMVDRLLDMASQDLSDRQRDMHILPRNYVKLDYVVNAAPAKRVLSAQFAASQAVLWLGIIITIALVLLREKFLSGRHGTPTPSVEEDSQQQLSDWSVSPVTRRPVAIDVAIPTSSSLAINSVSPPRMNSERDGPLHR
jgi:capsular polysaccharide biosynthesis protein